MFEKILQNLKKDPAKKSDQDKAETAPKAQNKYTDEIAKAQAELEELMANR